MSVPNDSTALSTTIDDGRASLSSQFLKFCDKVRNNDPSILPELGNDEPFKIGNLSEKEDIELADALMENTSVTYLQLRTSKYTKYSSEAMAKFVRTSKRLQRIYWSTTLIADDRVLKQHEEMLCCTILRDSDPIVKYVYALFYSALPTTQRLSSCHHGGGKTSDRSSLAITCRT
jgi:hypothetical protein